MSDLNLYHCNYIKYIVKKKKKSFKTNSYSTAHKHTKCQERNTQNHKQDHSLHKDTEPHTETSANEEDRIIFISLTFVLISIE